MKNPQVLLLDEPLAGMGTVFSLADRLAVIVNGQVIASGAPAAVRAGAAVQAVCLGELPKAWRRWSPGTSDVSSTSKGWCEVPAPAA